MVPDSAVSDSACARGTPYTDSCFAIPWVTRDFLLPEFQYDAKKYSPNRYLPQSVQTLKKLQHRIGNVQPKRKLNQVLTNTDEVQFFLHVFMQQFKVCRDGMADIEIRMYKLQNCYNFFLFMFAGQCVVNVFKQDQQDAKLHNGIYYYKCSTCFRRFLRPSSGAQNCIHNIGYFVELFLLLTAYSEFQLTHDSGKEPPETCTALIVTNVIVLRCVLLVLLQCNKYMLTFLKACILEQN